MSRKMSHLGDDGDNLSAVWTTGRNSLTTNKTVRSASVTQTEFTGKINLSKDAGSKEVQVIKLLSVILLPIITLIVLTSISLGQAIELRQQALQASTQVSLNLLIDTMVTNFQIERGVTASYLSSGGDNQEAYEQLLILRIKSDNAIEAINTWPAGGFKVPKLRSAVAGLQDPEDLFQTKQDFQEYLSRYRSLVRGIHLTVDEDIMFYTQINLAFLDWSVSEIKLPQQGNMWSKVVAATSMLGASDAIGIQRALGATFFTLCRFSEHTFNWFLDLEGQSLALLNLAYDYHTQSGEKFKGDYDGTNLQKDIELARANIKDTDYGLNCLGFKDTVRFDNSKYWFQNLTAYMTILVNIRKSLNQEIQVELEQVMAATSTEVATYSVVMVMVTVCSIAISIWYTVRIYSMIEKVGTYASKISKQSHQLQEERKKTDILLYQMLPQFIAAKLKTNTPIDAEHFDKATIYFSDVVGFTTISSKSSPLQVIDLLNTLYSIFDASIDRHNCYKVETIGDAYMVVSGLPQKTDIHAMEIANLSLELLQSAADFFIPHLPDTALELRIGVHTGPCVAGVVGVKMPRYCLFGETVNIASCMESSSKAQKIHIGQNTRDELTKIGGFILEPRDDISEVAGRKMKTYWLLGTTDKMTPEVKNDE